MLNLRQSDGRGGDTLGDRLRQAREEAGLTQEELSALSGISRVTISGLETGRITVTKTDTLTKIADALQKSVSYIFFNSDV